MTTSPDDVPQPDDVREQAEAEGLDVSRDYLLVPTTVAHQAKRLSEILDPGLLAQIETKQRAYLSVLAVNGLIGPSCRLAGVSRQSVTHWRNKGTNRAAFNDAERLVKDHASDLLEEEMFRRGVVGTLKPVYGRVGKDQDGIVGYERVHSDKLLLALAGAERPARFRTSRTELTGPGGGPVQVQPVVEQLKERFDALAARRREAPGAPATTSTQALEGKPAGEGEKS